RLVRVEVELDARTTGIVAEQLPRSCRGQPAQVVVDLVLGEARRHAAQIARAERHVIDDAAGVGWYAAAGDDVQDRLAAGIEPRARKAEVGAEALGQPQ